MKCRSIYRFGGNKKDRENAREFETRPMPFPDGIERVFTMSRNDWATFDHYVKTDTPTYRFAVAKILRDAPYWSEKSNLSLERTIRLMFVDVMRGFGRRREYGFKGEFFT